jgi:hypothetical protein
MIVDFYTKMILTVIAVSLFLIAVNPWIGETRLRIYAPGIEHSVGRISSAISSLDVGDRVGQPRKPYKKPELDEVDKAILDSLREALKPIGQQRDEVLGVPEGPDDFRTKGVGSHLFIVHWLIGMRTPAFCRA